MGGGWRWGVYSYSIDAFGCVRQRRERGRMWDRRERDNDVEVYVSSEGWTACVRVVLDVNVAGARCWALG